MVGAANAHKWRMVFIDDDVGIVKLYKLGLRSLCRNAESKRLGTEADIVSNGDAALALASELPADQNVLWILDIMLPQMRDGTISHFDDHDGLYTGIRVLECLKALAARRSTHWRYLGLTHMSADEARKKLSEQKLADICTVYEKDQCTAKEFSKVIDAFVESL